jgi:hypothetical protein
MKPLAANLILCALLTGSATGCNRSAHAVHEATGSYTYFVLQDGKVICRGNTITGQLDIAMPLLDRWQWQTVQEPAGASTEQHPLETPTTTTKPPAS